MKIIESKILKKFPEIKFGFSTKIGLGRKAPYFFNMSKSVGDNGKIVEENRQIFFEKVGVKKVVFQQQIHSDIVRIVDSDSILGESDAMITTETDLGLAVSSADCVPIFLYDSAQKIIAALHSGWRGTRKKILEKTLQVMFNSFGSDPNNIIAYIGPSISVDNYEVGIEVAREFDERYLKKINNKIYLDLKKINYHLLLNNEITPENIEVSKLCSFQEKDMLHSYRRNGKKSGRALGVIAISGGICV